MSDGQRVWCDKCEGLRAPEGHSPECPLASDDLPEEPCECPGCVARRNIAATVAWARGRIEHCNNVVRIAEVYGTDLPEALAERRALRDVVKMLERK